jgi:hypothetical protein
MTTTGTSYDLRVTIVDHVDNEGEPCTWCQLENATVQAQAYLPIGTVTQDMVECCLACLVPVIDSTPYLDSGSRVVVEVARSATRRPF